MLEAMTNYHPPVITSYAGPGSSLAHTEGDQLVIIEGRHFGPLGSTVAQAVYTKREVDEEYLQELGVARRALLLDAVHKARQDGRRQLNEDDLPPLFHAADCDVVLAHRRVECKTVEGAGADLRWYLLIGNQISETPSTDYAPPKIVEIIGSGAVDASTEGGDRVLMLGSNFGPETDLLDSVTYGTTGYERVASGCEVLNHTAIECGTEPGVGRSQVWIVSVEGQSSKVEDSPVTSYAAPAVTEVQLPPQGASTGGGGIVSVAVSNPGFAARANITLYVNNRGSPAPASIDQSWRDMMRGRALSQSAQEWLRQLAQVPVTNGGGELRGDGVTAQFEFDLPPGYGEDREVIVRLQSADGTGAPVYSPLQGLLTYDPPAITRTSPDRNSTMGNAWLRVFVQGVNFCDGREGCGQLLVDGQAVGFRADLEAQGDMLAPRIMRWTDEEIEFEIVDPTGAADVQV